MCQVDSSETQDSSVELVSRSQIDLSGSLKQPYVLWLCRWHRANDLVVPENIRLIPLPSYSPQLNPVEHLWDEIREKWFTNLVFDSLDALEDRLVQALATLERDTHRVQSITGFDWIVNIRLNAP